MLHVIVSPNFSQFIPVMVKFSHPCRQLLCVVVAYKRQDQNLNKQYEVPLCLLSIPSDRTCHILYKAEKIHTHSILLEHFLSRATIEDQSFPAH